VRAHRYEPFLSCEKLILVPSKLFVPSHRVHSVSRYFLFYKGDRLDTREQACMASCQDRYLDTRLQVQNALEKRQASM
jgi:Tim10/DDP family zinc finger